MLAGDHPRLRIEARSQAAERLPHRQRADVSRTASAARSTTETRDDDFAFSEPYVRNQRALGTAARIHEFRTLLRRLRKLNPLPPGSKVCENWRRERVVLIQRGVACTPLSR
jgi:hypothetical protein